MIRSNSNPMPQPEDASTRRPRAHAFDTGRPQRQMPAMGLPPGVAVAEVDDADIPLEMEGLAVVDPMRRRRLRGLVLYVILFATVAALFVYLFTVLTDSLKVAVVAVVFLLGYMLIAAKLAEKHVSTPMDRGGLG